MEATVERGGFSALGALFQNVITDLKTGMPLWEDFISKAAKLHAQLKSTILTTTSYLDSFQKIADLATNARGATKDIGTALTRIILRHKAVEARLKTFTSSILDCLILPLQDKMEEWKKTITQLDKDHAKEHKKARQEIKKRSSDTLRLQKKVRKGKCEIQRCLDNALHDVNEKFVLLEETEKHALRLAFVEERSHFCLLVACLKPVVDEEVAMMSEITHLQEIMEHLLKHTTDPFTLPPATEQIINDVKGLEGSVSFQTPPSSPSSLGSRKSSVCSMSSLTSSSSGSTKSRSSPSHQFRHRNQPKLISAGTFRLSHDSGFTSQDTLFLRPPTPPPLELAKQVFTSAEGLSPENMNSSMSIYGQGPTATSTWPNLQETAAMLMTERPHTISSAYEKGHFRPPLTIHTFDPPEKSLTDEGTDDDPTPDGSQDRLAWVPTLTHASSVGCVTLPDFNRTAPNQVVPQPLPTAVNKVESRAYITQADFVAALTQGLQQRDGRWPDPPSEEDLTNESSKYCTMPRYSSTPFRPGETSSGELTPTLRRSNSQTHKPPLPIRRTSSISSQQSLTAAVSQSATLTRSVGQVSENKPLTTTSNKFDTISSDLKAALENRKRLIEEEEAAALAGKTSPPCEAIVEEMDSVEKKKESPPKTINNSNNLNATKKPTPLTSSVAAPTRPRSPRMGSLARRMSEPGRYQTLDGTSKNAALRSPRTKITTNTAVNPQKNFLQNLNAKLAEHVHKQQQSEESQTVDKVDNIKKVEKVEKVDNMRKTNKVDRMDKVDNSRSATRRMSAGDVAIGIQQKLANRPVLDASACRESLLDQIRQGTTLRKWRGDSASRL